jgi:hypothetical protein
MTAFLDEKKFKPGLSTYQRKGKGGAAKKAKTAAGKSKK